MRAAGFGPWRAALALLVLTLVLGAPARTLARDTAPEGPQKVTQKTARALPAAGAIGVREARALLANPPEGLIVLDVRTPQEFREGHLAGARNLDFFGGAFEMEAQELPKDAPVLLYCKSGRRSAAAAESLAGAGHGRVLHMREGLAGWIKAGLPLTK